MENNKSAAPDASSNHAVPEFTNPAVDESALPGADGLKFEGLAPTYLHILIVEIVLAWVLLLTLALVTGYFVDVVALFLGQVRVLAPLGLLIAFSFTWPPLLARSRGFALREQDIHYRSGIIWQKTVSLPYNRIQHVEMESDPLERLFKLTTVKFFTSGGGKADMKIPALTFERGSRLRAYVIDKAAGDKKIAKADNDRN